jgi:hypothetical protein
MLKNRQQEIALIILKIIADILYFFAEIYGKR